MFKLFKSQYHINSIATDKIKSVEYVLNLQKLLISRVNLTF